MVYALASACTALLLTVLFGLVLVPWLRARRIGKAESGEEPEEYAKKEGKPTMGGLMFLLPIVGVSVPNIAREPDILLPVLAMAAAGVLGIFDDMQTLVGKQKLSGHEPWFWAVKWAVLIGIGVAMAAYLFFALDMRHLLLPHFGAYDLAAVYLPLAALVFVVGVSGAVITDGMDGLMAGVSALAYLGFGVIALAQGQPELGAFALTVVGGAAGFLWHNAYPARVIMGEVGAQALSVGVIVLAFMTGWWVLLPVIGVIFVMEGLSDVIQIGYFKLSKGKRVFRMAPIHYHFQLSGWAETQVVARFWLVGLVGAMAGIALALIN